MNFLVVEWKSWIDLAQWSQ